MGIYGVDLYLRVRPACAEGMSQREAARIFNVSRGTVWKLSSFSAPPGYRRTAEVRRPKLDSFIPILGTGWKRNGPCRASNGMRRSRCSTGFARNATSPAAKRSLRTTWESGRGAGRRCSRHCRILRATLRRTSATRACEAKQCSWTSSLCSSGRVSASSSGPSNRMDSRCESSTGRVLQQRRSG